MSRKKKTYVLEFISILFAVMLAMVLDEWRQDVKNQKLLDRVIESTKAELTQNLEAVTTAIPYRANLIQELRSNTHLISKLPVAELGTLASNDRLLANHIKSALLEQDQTLYDRVEIRRNNGKRLLIIEKEVYRLETKNDTIFMYCSGNIQLRTASLGNNSWELAQATNVILEMPFELVDELSLLRGQQEFYLQTADDAIEKIYSGETQIMGILEDMAWLERQLKVDYERILAMIEEMD